MFPRPLKKVDNKIDIKYSKNTLVWSSFFKKKYYKTDTKICEEKWK